MQIIIIKILLLFCFLLCQTFSRSALAQPPRHHHSRRRRQRLFLPPEYLQRIQEVKLKKFRKMANSLDAYQVDGSCSSGHVHSPHSTAQTTHVKAYISHITGINPTPKHPRNNMVTGYTGTLFLVFLWIRIHNG